MIDHTRSFDKDREQRAAGGYGKKGASVVESGLEKADITSKRLALALYSRSN